MKYLFLLLISTSIYASTEKEIGLGAYTYHLMGDSVSSSRFANKQNKSGSLIFNTMAFYKQTIIEKKDYDSTTVFGGQNSMGSGMAGWMLSTGAVTGKHLESGFVGGLYLQDNSKYLSNGVVNSFALYQDKGMAIVPILGIEVNLKVPVYKGYFFKINNLITPVLTNHTISVGIEF